jgi:pyridoxal phosphate-dependent aminotransferase EpsN
MHLQAVHAGCETVDRGVAARLFERGLCLPSGSAMADTDVEKVLAALAGAVPRAARSPRTRQEAAT